MRGKSISAANDNKMADNKELDECLQDNGLDNVTDNGFNLDDADFYQNLPDALVVTNVSESVFNNPIAKREFEDVFTEFDEDVTFTYLKSFRRVRVQFTSPENAVKARIQIDEANICGSCVKCFLPQVLITEKTEPHLQPPAPQKQFLISPPASPPVGWEQMQEAEPVINYDLIAAMAQLTPGEAHELHAQTDDQPAIIVHICEEPVDLFGEKRPKIPQTRCPERRT